MENGIEMGKGVIGAVGAALTWLWGPWDTALVVLLAVITLDYIAGVANATVHRKLSSAEGWKGLLKKMGILIILAIAALVDRVVPAANGALRSAVCFFYIANEGISILENLGAMVISLYF